MLFNIEHVKKKVSIGRECAAGLGNRCQVSGELIFLDDQIVLFIEFNQTQVSEISA